MSLSLDIGKHEVKSGPTERPLHDGTADVRKCTMVYTQSRRVASRFVELSEASSTNDELAVRAREGASAWPDFSVVVTTSQSAGRGRLGRAWTAPPGTMLATSVLLWPSRSGISDPDALGWLPLIAGIAMMRAVRAAGVQGKLKWPNDVLVRHKKICGILSEVMSDGAVILGAGVNLTLTKDQLPVHTATSLALEGGDTDEDALLSTYLNELRTLYGLLATADNRVVRDLVRAACSTICRTVRVDLPDGSQLVGIGEDLDFTGRLIINVDGRRTAVSAGDVTHLRY